MRRVWAGLAMAVVMATSTVGYRAATDGGAPPEGSANVWVDTDGGSCDRSSPAAYSSATACESIGDAWTEASAGDTIRVADGTYTTECTLSGAKGSETFIIGNDSATNFICTITTAQNSTFQNLQGYQVNTGATDATFEDVVLFCTDAAPYELYATADKCTARVWVNHSNFSWTGGSIGPSYDASACVGGDGEWTSIGGGGSDPDNVVFRNVRFHDIYNTECDDAHTEHIRVDGGSNITFDGVLMECGGSTGSMFVSDNGNTGQEPSNVTIKNSLIRDTGGCATGDGGTTAIGFNVSPCSNGPVENIQIVNVIAHGALVFDSACSSWTGSVIANTVWRGANPCPSGVATFSHNAPYQPNTGGTTDQCGSDTSQVGIGTTSNNSGPPSAWFTCGSTCPASAPSAHTQAGSSPLINAGTNTYNPGSDYGGLVTRPCGGTVDIGIWESGC